MLQLVSEHVVHDLSLWIVSGTLLTRINVKLLYTEKSLKVTLVFLCRGIANINSLRKLEFTHQANVRLST